MRIVFKVIAYELTEFRRFSAFFKAKKLIFVAEVEVVWETEIIEENPFAISLIVIWFNYIIPPTMLIKGESDLSNWLILSIVMSEISTTEEINLTLV